MPALPAPDWPRDLLELLREISGIGVQLAIAAAQVSAPAKGDGKVTPEISRLASRMAYTARLVEGHVARWEQWDKVQVQMQAGGGKPEGES